MYRVTVGADGRGTFEGRRDTAVTGTRSFTISPVQYRAFRQHLDPLRPLVPEVRYSGDRCSQTATDLPSAEVTWVDASGRGQILYFYFGCDMEQNRAIAERLRAAPRLLPIAEFIRRR